MPFSLFRPSEHFPWSSLCLSFCLNLVCRFGFQGALETRPRNIGKKHRKFIKSLLVPCILVSFPIYLLPLSSQDPQRAAPRLLARVLIVFSGRNRKVWVYFILTSTGICLLIFALSLLQRLLLFNTP